jgi:hypothetical protein
MTFDESFREDALYHDTLKKSTVFRRDRIRCKDNIMMDFGKTRIEGVDWTSQVQNSAQWRAVLNTVRNFRVPQETD